jgi:hypothetical protein
VITFVATVQVTAEPSERFSNAAPLTVVRSLRVIVLSVLTVASKVTTCFVDAGVMIVCLFDVTVSALSTIFFYSSFWTCFCQACPIARVKP